MKKFLARSKSVTGFTLMEIVVVMAVTAVLAAMLSPTILGVIDDARRSRALSDDQAIASAILAFNKDLNRWPIWQNGAKTGPTDATFDVLKTDDGEDPLVGDDSGWSLSGAGSLDDQLMTNFNSAPGNSYPTSGDRQWRGPYLAKLTEDPWGSKYVANVNKLSPGEDYASEAVYVLSAGPNRLIETEFGQSVNGTFEVGGDDIVHRIK